MTQNKQINRGACPRIASNTIEMTDGFRNALSN